MKNSRVSWRLSTRRDVFISYSHEDKEKAAAISEFLERHGIRCWFDQHRLKLTDEFEKKINKAIRKCCVVLWLASKHSLQSSFVKYEITVATSRAKPIGPIFLEPITEAERQAPFNFPETRVHGICYYQSSIEENLGRILADVQPLIRKCKLKRMAALAAVLVLVVALICYWKNETPKQVPETELERKLIGHSAAVTSLEFSDDGETLASGSADGTVKVWNARTGELIRTLTGSGDQIRTVAFSPDGRILIAGSSEEKTLSLWDAATWELKRTIEGGVTSLAFSPDSQHVLAGGHAKRVRLWNVQQGILARELENSESAHAVAVSHDGQRALSGGIDGSVRLWDLNTGTEINRFLGHTKEVTGVAFLPDDITALSSSMDSTLILWNLKTGKEVRRLKGHKAGVNGFAIAPDGNHAISVSRDETTKMWNLETGDEIKVWDVHDGVTLCVAISPDGGLLATGDESAIVQLSKAPVAHLGSRRSGTLKSQEEPANETGASVMVKANNGKDIQMAIDKLPATGGKIIILAATPVIVYKTIVIGGDNVTLEGEGADKTVLRLADGAEVPILIVGEEGASQTVMRTNIHVRNLTLDGNRLNQHSEISRTYPGVRNNGICLRRVEECSVVGVTIFRCRSAGLMMELGCRRVTIRNLESSENNFDGLAAYETEDSLFEYLKLHGNLAAGLSFDLRFVKNVINNADIVNSGTVGIFMRDSRDNVFSDIHIQKSARHGIFLAQVDTDATKPAAGNTFTSCVISESGGAGIRVNDASCVNNLLRASQLVKNGGGGVSEVSQDLLTITTSVIK